MRFIITILLLFFSFWQDGWTDDYRQWYLPEEAAMRLGKGKVFDIAFSPNSKHFMVADSMGIWVYDARYYKPIALLTADSYNVSRIAMNKITFSQDGSTFATVSPTYGSSEDFRIRIWNAYTGKLKTHVREGPMTETSAIAAFVLSPNGKTLVTWNYDKKIRLWDIQTGEHKATLTGQMNSALAISPDGNILANVGQNATSIQLRDMETTKLIKTIPIRGTHKVNWLAFFSDAVLATGNLYETVRFWNLNTLEHTEINLSGNIENLQVSAFSPTTKMLASATRDGVVQLWDLQTQQLTVVPTDNSRTLSLAFSPDGLRLACAGIDGTIRFYEVKTQRHIANITSHSGHRKSSLAFSQDGRMLAGNGQLWDLKTGLPHHSLIPPNIGFSYNAFDTLSPDGKMLASINAEDIFLSYTETGALRTILKGHLNRIRCIAFSPDGKILASGGATYSSGGNRHPTTIRVWNVLTGEQITAITEHKNGIISIAFSPDGKILASGGGDNTIHFWDPKTGEHKLTLIGHTGSVTCVAFSPDGKTLASASYVLRDQYNRNPDYAIWLWDLQTGKQKVQLSGHTEHVLAVAFSPDGKTLASASKDKTIRLWSIQTNKHLRTFKGHVKEGLSVAFSPDGKMLASSHQDGTILLWDISEKRGKQMKFLILILALFCVFTVFTQAQEIDSGYTYLGLPDGATARIGKSGIAGRNAIAISPDGTRLAAATTIGVWIYDTDTSKELSLLTEHTGPVTSVAFSTDGKTLAGGSVDTTIRLWDTETGKHKATLIGHVGGITLLQFLPDGETLASGSYDDTIRLWDLKTRQLKATLGGHTDGVHSITVSQDGSMLASNGWQKNMLWDAKTGERLATFIVEIPDKIERFNRFGRVISGALSPDASILISWDIKQGIRLWDTKTGKRITDLRLKERTGFNTVALSPDGKTLASDGEENEIQLWDVNSRKPQTTLTDQIGYVHHILFSPKGDTLISLNQSSADHRFQQIWFWDVKKAQPKANFRWQTQSVYSTIFSDDDKTFAAHNYSEIKVWDVQTGQLKTTFTGHNEAGHSVKYFPDGKTLVSWTYNEVFLRDVKTGNPRVTIRESNYPTFSPNGKMYATKPYKQPIQLWNTETATLKMTLPETSTEYMSMIFSSDNRMLASFRDGGKVFICDLLSGKITHTITLQRGGAENVIFLPNRKTLATLSKSWTVQLWDLITGELKDTLTKETEKIVYITASPDGDILAGVGDDGSVRLWNTETGSLRSTLKFDDGFITEIKFSSDAKTLVSNGGQDDNSILLWDVATGTIRTTFAEDIRNLWSSQFSPDGNILVSFDEERKSILVWDMKTGSLSATFTNNANRIESFSISPDSKTLASGHEDGTILFWDLTKYSK